MSDEQKKESKKKSKDMVISLKTLSLEASPSTPEVWLAYSFAPEWFNDALREARTGADYDSRRREILFSVCFAESYLVEWVRDEVLKGRDIKEFKKYLMKKTAVDKWKDIPKQLHKDGLIPHKPDLSGEYWREWKKLVRYRNGLVHAAASRPESKKLSDNPPMPPKRELDQLQPGWAVRVVIELVKHLHKAAGTSPPEWLIKP